MKINVSGLYEEKTKLLH